MHPLTETTGPGSRPPVVTADETKATFIEQPQETSFFSLGLTNPKTFSWLKQRKTYLTCCRLVSAKLARLCMRPAARVLCLRDETVVPNLTMTADPNRDPSAPASTLPYTGEALKDQLKPRCPFPSQPRETWGCGGQKVNFLTRRENKFPKARDLPD